MPITRARTRASARGRRLVVNWQDGPLALQPKIAKCYTITAPRPGSFRFMPLNPRFGNAIVMFTSALPS